MPSPPPPSAPDSSGSPCPHCGEPHPVSYGHCPKTGKPLTSGRALIGRVIAGRYRVIGLLGEGGMGAVYVAEHTLIGRKVAIKRLHPELASDETAVQRFQREARTAAATGHEHIVEILDLGFAEDGAPYLVMEYLRGQSLAALLRKERLIDPRRACDIVGQVLAALKAVHGRHIVHRDLKPDNVLLTRRGGRDDYVKILDFGISKMKRDEGVGFDLTRTGVMLGTPFYMSPEQARGVKDLDHRVDLYAAGVILYESITGRVPFEGDNYHQLLQAILRSEPRRPRDIVPGIDPALEEVVLKSIAKDPEHRYPSAEAMLLALLPFGARPASSSEVLQSGEGPGLGSVDDEASTLAIEGATEAFALAEAPALAPTVPPHAAARLREPSGLGVDALARASDPALGPRVHALIGTPSTPSIPVALAEPSPIGPRSFFAASDDWDEAKARAAIEAAPAPLRSGNRDPIARGGLGRAHRVGRRRALGAQPSRDPGRDAGGAGSRDAGISSSSSPMRQPAAVALRDVTPLGREGPRLVAPTDTGPAVVREPITAMVGQPTLSPDVVGAPPRVTPAAQQPEVKASLVIAALDHLATAHGTAKVAAVRSQLDREAQERLQGVLFPMAWLPLGLYDQLLRIAERVVGGIEGTVGQAIGCATADRELPATHRLFMQTASPAAAVDRIPQFFRSYHSRGEAKVSPSATGAVRVELDAGAPESLAYTWAMAGFYHRMLELTGARDVRVGVVSYRARGDDRTTISLRWR